MSSSTGIADSAIVASLDAVLGAAHPVLSVAPVALESPGRDFPLQVRVSAPRSGAHLPVLLFSHGNGWSLDGYAPLTAYWASQGFVVVQPTHVDSRRNGVGFDDERFGAIWTRRYDDLVRVLDQLDTIESALPGLAGRIDRSTAVAAGHSWGGQTVQMLLGARIVDADGSLGMDRREERVKAGVLMAATGVGGEELHPFAKAHFPFMNPSFAQLSAPTLVVAGDHDQSAMSSRGPDWFTDAYHQSPGATDLLTLFGAEHSLGGIANHEAVETTDEDPERVAVLARLGAAYLRAAATGDTAVWDRAREAFAHEGTAVGRIDSK
ncbi:prolyl oligopeptidase family serine peptidase [Nocardiopsis sp. MG754419]|uniref:alpha/beta hydrolase family protein n=1 Tax=Nocardiopsis sp. MG754419 TaxID=2259865 RepID=UPI001BAB9807|nr:prolyl oligopeptidase family serine peptidase [Nocardiopsis sp. MG754419]MBR8743425.1 chlorophyllase [Nocardiopsis sp. MG754419]